MDKVSGKSEPVDANIEKCLDDDKSVSVVYAVNIHATANEVFLIC
jgi:hypothetical protein